MAVLNAKILMNAWAIILLKFVKGQTRSVAIISVAILAYAKKAMK
jgi:hypothetical protein